MKRRLHQIEQDAVVTLGMYLDGDFHKDIVDVNELRVRSTFVAQVRELIAALNLAFNPPETITDDEWNEADRRLRRLLFAFESVPTLKRDKEGVAYIASEASSTNIPDPMFAPAVNATLILANAGLLSSMMDCPVCERFFYPKKAGSATCGGACSRTAYEKKPASREVRRVAGRKRYESLTYKDAILREVIGAQPAKRKRIAR